jgi:hypothetical protein
MESQRIEKLEQELEVVKADIVVIKVGQAKTDSKLDSIDEKLDRIIQIDNQWEKRFQEKGACEVVRLNLKEDINGLGDKARTIREDFQEHEKMHWKKADRYATWLTTSMVAVFIIAKLAKLI